jgi:putative endopeptidase
MRIITLFVFILAFTAAAFGQNQPLHGVQVTDINSKIDPCTDFFEYANGNWRANNPIPASLTRWSRRWEAGEKNKEALKEILETASASSSPKGSIEQLIGDYYGSCMDEKKINTQGISALKPWLDPIDSIHDLGDLQKVILMLHDIAIPVPFGLTGSPDNHNPNQVLADLYASGLGLPDRDYYVKPEARFQDAREKYRAHVKAMFQLAGSDPKAAAAASETVFNMETKFAEASLDNVALRDPASTDHKSTFDELQKMVPDMSWKDYIQKSGLSTNVDLNIQQPKFMQEVERQLKQTSLDDWKTYLKWQLLDSTARYLSDPFLQEHWNFYGKYLSGATEMKPRWKRCAESADEELGEALGKKYVEKYFPPAAKARMQELVKNILGAMKDDIQTISWMGEDTKKKALEKLATFNVKVGYPDKWKDYSKVQITRDSFLQNVIAGHKFNVQDDRSTIGKPVDRGRWGMTPPTSDAYNNFNLNEIVFPAGILQPPAFSMDVVDAVNYGAIGVVIGHEISHGFDDQGAKFDAQGRLQNWWTEKDLKQFQERGACVADQFENYFIEEGVHHNGQLVLGESIGDLGGARLAYMAWKRSLKGKPAPKTIDDFTPDQQFFIAWGQFRGDATRIETQRLMIQGDPHPVAKYRVNGPLSNLPEFQQAFGCKENSAMVRPPAKRCQIW